MITATKSNDRRYSCTLRRLPRLVRQASSMRSFCRQTMCLAIRMQAGIPGMERCGSAESNTARRKGTLMPLACDPKRYCSILKPVSETVKGLIEEAYLRLPHNDVPLRPWAHILLTDSWYERITEWLYSAESISADDLDDCMALA